MSFVTRDSTNDHAFKSSGAKMDNAWDNKVPPRGNVTPVDIASAPYVTGEAPGNGSRMLLIVNLVLRALTFIWTVIALAILVSNKVVVTSLTDTNTAHVDWSHVCQYNINYFGPKDHTTPFNPVDPTLNPLTLPDPLDYRSDSSPENDSTEYPVTIKFDVFFFLSYLLAIDTLCLVYVLVTAILFAVYFRRLSTPRVMFLTSFILDQTFAYLLMSSASSAAAGIQTITTSDCGQVESLISELALVLFLDCPTTWVTPSFISKSYGAAVMTFVASVTIATAALITGLKWVKNSS